MSATKDLQEVGLRATRQRIALLELLKSERNPVDVETLTEKGGGQFDTATAYRILEAFREHGLAHRIDLSKGRALYEVAGVHHHHAVCQSCGNIQNVDACVPAALDERVRKATGFKLIERHTLEFFGLCKKCANA